MTVLDHGLDAIRKSTYENIPGDKTEYHLLVDLLKAITGTFIQQTISDPNDGIRTTRKTVGDIPIRFPLIGETINPSRNTISILNKDPINTIYFHVKSTFTTGWSEGSVLGPSEIGPGESFNTPCGKDVFIWIACETSKTAMVVFGEYA